MDFDGEDIRPLNKSARTGEETPSDVAVIRGIKSVVSIRHRSGWHVKRAINLHAIEVHYRSIIPFNTRVQVRQTGNIGNHETVPVIICDVSGNVRGRGKTA